MYGNKQRGSYDLCLLVGCNCEIIRRIKMMIIKDIPLHQNIVEIILNMRCYSKILSNYSGENAGQLIY